MKTELNQLKTEQQYLAIISEFAIDMLSIDSIDQVLWHTAKNVVSKLDFEDVVIYLFDKNRKLLIQKAAFGAKSPFEDEIINPIEIKLGCGVVGEAAVAQIPIVVDDTRLHPSYIVDDHSRLSEIAVPMVIDGQLLGVIDSEHPDKGFYNRHKQRVIVAIASIIAVQISKIRMVTQLEDTIENLEYSRKVQNSLFGITEIIFESKSIKEFYTHLHHFISRITFANNFYVALLSDDEQSFVIQYRVDEMDDINETLDIKIPFKGQNIPSITGYTLILDQPLLIYEQEIKQMIKDKNFHIIGATPIAWLGVPFGNESFRGIVVVQSYFGGYLFTQKDKRLLSFVAKHIRNALESMKDREKLEFLALHDPLTRLPNRLLFIDRVSHAIAHTKRNKQASLAIFFLDLDKFKLINDHHGHHVGDKLLIEVSTRIRNCLRESDTLCRLGGDEFAILLENVNESYNLKNIAQDILNEVAQPIVIDNLELNISISIGSCSFSSGDTSCSQLLIQADEAMYKAKELGRNQVHFYTTPT
ncbi:MAG: diguanylate cyclase [Colwellia sp.]|nr:diguanylate cyclase [Colwellia sp.]